MSLAKSKIHNTQKYLQPARWFFIVFYAVGVAGMLIPITSPLFKTLIPFAILISLFAVWIFHEKYSAKTFLAFAFIYILGFLAELAGVNTGVIFGQYNYGTSLGIQVYHTPLIIGINWFLLVYLSAAVVDHFKIHTTLKIVAASIIMVAYDFIVEHVAASLGMWEFRGNEVPLKNYIAWFGLSLLFHFILKLFKIKTTNKIAPVILLCQFGFFAILWITLNQHT